MRKFALFVVGIIAAPFMGGRATAADKKVNVTIELARRIGGKHTTVEVKSLEQMKLAHQDHSGPRGKTSG